MTHSFSVDEIQKMRVKLKTSTSFPNNEMRQQQTTSSVGPQHNHLPLPMHHLQLHHEEGDNSSSGVSSDQEMNTQIHAPTPMKPQSQYQPPYSSTHIIHSHPKSSQLDLNKSTPLTTTNKPNTTPPTSLGFGTLRKKNHHHHIRTIDMDREAAAMATSDHEEDDRDPAIDHDSPSPPSKGFQRHNSLTRKQAASIAMNRAMQTRSSAVSLVKLPPPIESDHDEPDAPLITMRNSPHNLRRTAAGTVVASPPEQIVLAPPPQFCDCIHAASGQQHNQHQLPMPNNPKSMMGSVIANGGGTIRGVRIVGALPKVNTNLNVMNEMIASGDTS